MRGGPERSPGTASDPTLALRYDRPAADRETESLPIGNGAPGANVFDGVRTERLTYDEKTPVDRRNGW
ncbi:glycoside hydrolase N-terminal domain-containing protein [Micromonospora sp. NBC_01796]|uniref:glycoside hydrolase N-terminal domain-containing protein n=1 Tax=Micromonospora sp. NBC_01796 TaxID=2975987 RepID=UPI002DDB24D0|nr:glycoside hydrolase N-terminal domain-containing protein [Micromonospora sp. NBC_01796]WSA86066.1 glycoside hydrolase family 95 protein [Micromonospora sp. NBC_01796]